MRGGEHGKDESQSSQRQLSTVEVQRRRRDSDGPGGDADVDLPWFPCGALSRLMWPPAPASLFNLIYYYACLSISPLCFLLFLLSFLYLTTVAIAIAISFLLLLLPLHDIAVLSSHCVSTCSSVPFVAFDAGVSAGHG